MNLDGSEAASEGELTRDSRSGDGESRGQGPRPSCTSRPGRGETRKRRRWGATWSWEEERGGRRPGDLEEEGADSGAKCCCKTTENEDREEPVGSGRMKAVGDLGRAVSVAPGNRVQAEWTRQRWRRWCGAGGQALLRVQPGPVVAAGSRGRGVGPRGAAPPCGAGGRCCGGGGGMRGLRCDHRTVGSCRCSGPA